jgi:hypothetical protein
VRPETWRDESPSKTLRRSPGRIKMAGMKMEFLRSGAPDCPLIRFYEFRPSEAQSLRRIALQLARGRTPSAQLHKEQGIQAISGCQLTLSRGEKDQGVFETRPVEFAWVLTGGGWLSVSDLIRPFSRADSRGYQWLWDGGNIRILISRDGSW